MVPQVLRYLAPQHGGKYVDCTVGGGGHARAILKSIGPDGQLLGLDRDSESLESVTRSLADFPNFIPYHANFRDLPRIIETIGWKTVDGIMYDLGFSSIQVDSPDRGFSFQREGPLDMRMDRTDSVRAEDLVNQWPEKKIGLIIKDYGEEPFARRLAKSIVRARQKARIITTTELRRILQNAVPTGNPGRKLLAVRRTFMAIRIALNRELEDLDQVFEQAVACLETSGRMVVLSYHSLEDRITKHTFLRLSGRCTCPPGFPECRCGKKATLKILVRKPITPEEGEILDNPRARGAKLRAVERL